MLLFILNFSTLNFHQAFVLIDYDFTILCRSNSNLFFRSRGVSWLPREFYRNTPTLIPPSFLWMTMTTAPMESWKHASRMTIWMTSTNEQSVKVFAVHSKKEAKGLFNPFLEWASCVCPVPGVPREFHVFLTTTNLPKIYAD